MTQARAKQVLARWLPVLALAVFALAAILYVVAVTISGGSLPGFLFYPAVFVLAVLLPGLWLCRLLLPQLSGASRLVLAIPLGASALVLCFALLGWFVPAVFCTLPCVFIGLLFLWQSRKQLFPVRMAAVPPAFWWLLLLFSTALFLYLFTGVFPYAKPSAAGNMQYNQDLLWSISNASAAGYGMPVRDMRTTGGVLHYYYFTDILGGLVAQLSGQRAWDAVCYFGWPIWFGALLGAAYLVGRRFGAGPYAALLAPVGVTLAHHAYSDLFIHIFENPNGVLQGSLYLAAAVLFLQFSEASSPVSRSGLRNLVAFIMVAMPLLWGKGTVGILLLCAIGAAFVVYSLLQRQFYLRGLVMLLGGAAVFAVLYLSIYRFAINNLAFQPSTWALENAVRILFWESLPVTLLYLVSLIYSFRQFKTLSFSALVVNALVPGGVVAFVLFYHYSASQNYFILTACFAMWLCIARVAGELLKKRWLAGATLGLSTLAVAVALWGAAPALRHGVQTALRCVQLRPEFPAQQDSISRDDAAAAEWLYQNMRQDEVFATNRNAQDDTIGEGVFHYYTAASQRQAYVESWRYAMDYSMDYHLLRHNLEVVSDGIFATADFATAAAVARENGIDYLLVYLPFDGIAFDGAEPVFSSETVLIYRV